MVLLCFKSECNRKILPAVGFNWNRNVTLRYSYKCTYKSLESISKLNFTPTERSFTAAILSTKIIMPNKFLKSFPMPALYKSLSTAAKSLTPTNKKKSSKNSHTKPKKNSLSNLRPYQKECIEATLKNHKLGILRQAVSLPVGTGKTVVMSHLIPSIPPPTPKATKTLILAHRQELLFQAMEKISTICPNLKVDLERGAHKCDISKTDVIVASVQSLGITTSSRLERFDPSDFKCIIIDEAHHASAATYARVLKHFGLYESQPQSFSSEKTVSEPAQEKQFSQKYPILLWGCSATLRRHDGIRLSSIFDYVTYHKDFFEMVSENWLCDIKVTTVKTKVDISDVSSRLGDFVTSQLATNVDTPQRNELIVHTYRRLAMSCKSTIVFCVSLKHVENLATSFRKHGLEATTITSMTPPDLRTVYLDRFRRQEISIIINCDVPSVDCLIMARPTKSQTLYQQMLGRGMRPSPNKKHCLVLDFVDIFRDKTLCSVPTLLGLDSDSVVNDQSLTDLIIQQENEQPVTSLAPRLPPAIKSINLKHFNSIYDLNQNRDPEDVPFRAYSELEWIFIKDDVYVLPVSVGCIRVERTEEGMFLAKFRRRIPKELLSSKSMFARVYPLPIQAESLETVVRGVETFLSKTYPESFSIARRKAPWRTTPITKSQIKMISRIFPDLEDLYEENSEQEKVEERFSYLTKGEASNIIALVREGGLKSYRTLVKKAELARKIEESENSKKITVGPFS